MHEKCFSGKEVRIVSQFGKDRERKRGFSAYVQAKLIKAAAPLYQSQLIDVSMDRHRKGAGMGDETQPTNGHVTAALLSDDTQMEHDSDSFRIPCWKSPNLDLSHFPTHFHLFIQPNVLFLLSDPCKRSHLGLQFSLTLATSSAYKNQLSTSGIHGNSSVLITCYSGKRNKINVPEFTHL